MAQYDEKTKTWTGRFQFEKKDHWKRGFATRDDAVHWEVTEKRKLKFPHLYPQEPEPEPPPPQTTPLISVVSLVNKYLEHCSTRYAPNTRRSKKFIYQVFVGFLGRTGDPHEIPAESITKPMVKAFSKEVAAGNIALDEKEDLDNLGKTKKINRTRNLHKTANRYTREICTLFNFGIDEEIMRYNPAVRIERHNEEHGGPKFSRFIPSIEHMEKVILAADPFETEVLTFYFYTLGRKSEIRTLTWEDVNLEKKQIQIWTKKRKGGGSESDWLPMAPELYAMIKRRWDNRNKESMYVFPKPDGEILAEGSYLLRNILDRICTRIKVKRFGLHGIRHHGASRMEDSGKVTLRQIQLMMRHKNLTTTEKYLHGMDRTLMEAANFLDDSRQQSKLEVVAKAVAESKTTKKTATT
ncbi:MAG: tyrosine-type recombinase/integrase [Syntrophobacteraceae bacterium]